MSEPRPYKNKGPIEIIETELKKYGIIREQFHKPTIGIISNAIMDAIESEFSLERKTEDLQN